MNSANLVMFSVYYNYIKYKLLRTGKIAQILRELDVPWAF